MAIDDIWMRFLENMVARVSGPMKFRLLLQPTMAMIFAIRSGMKDAREGRSPFFWTLLTEANSRAYLLKDGWKSVGKVFILALVLDVVYQIIVSRFVFPLEAFITAILLAIVPYLFLRGLTTRIVRKK
jgi:hypothetical protein